MPNGDASSSSRTLSKSDFILARECPAKLYFRENGYPDGREGDEYMRLLAEGGYMVEALAKARYPDGIQLEYGRDVVADFARTMAALEAHDVTLFEATLLIGRRQARVDILEKRGSVLRLIEVKAKSFDGHEHAALIEHGRAGVFRTSTPPHRIRSHWDKKLADLTYQLLLLEACMPGCTILPFLALVDKSKSSGLDNVPGYFELVRRDRADGSRGLYSARYVGTREQLTQLDLVTEVSMANEVAMLRESVAAAAATFESRLDAPFAAHREGAERGARCKKCEFNTPDAPQSGFRDCWGEMAHASPHVLELFHAGDAKAPDGTSLLPWMLGNGTAALLDVPLEGLVQKDHNPAGVAARQRRQVEYSRLDRPFIAPELSHRIVELGRPIHFIDFETSRLALPYHRGMRPYGLVAFQWSAHTVDALGQDPRHSEWLNATDAWPNQLFAESLRAAIGDEGPVLTWTQFESATLRQIVPELAAFGHNAPELIAWIADVTERRVVDLNRWACADYYHPGMRGSTSIKRVLEALWRSDPVMRQQLTRWTGMSARPDDDPYLALPPVMINGVRQDVHEGTGAMRAYQEMMYGAHKHDPAVRDGWAALLKQYCRLDTLSMVLILEHWRRATGLA